MAGDDVLGMNFEVIIFLSLPSLDPVSANQYLPDECEDRNK
jgi:hypothetical protein